MDFIHQNQVQVVDESERLTTKRMTILQDVELAGISANLLDEYKCVSLFLHKNTSGRKVVLESGIAITLSVSEKNTPQHYFGFLGIGTQPILSDTELDTVLETMENAEDTMKGMKTIEKNTKYGNLGMFRLLGGIHHNNKRRVTPILEQGECIYLNIIWCLLPLEVIEIDSQGKEKQLETKTRESLPICCLGKGSCVDLLAVC